MTKSLVVFLAFFSLAYCAAITGAITVDPDDRFNCGEYELTWADANGSIGSSDSYAWTVTPTGGSDVAGTVLSATNTATVTLDGSLLTADTTYVLNATPTSTNDAPTNPITLDFAAVACCDIPTTYGTGHIFDSQSTTPGDCTCDTGEYDDSVDTNPCCTSATQYISSTPACVAGSVDDCTEYASGGCSACAATHHLEGTGASAICELGAPVTECITYDGSGYCTACTAATHHLEGTGASATCATGAAVADCITYDGSGYCTACTASTHKLEGTGASATCATVEEATSSFLSLSFAALIVFLLCTI